MKSNLHHADTAGRIALGPTKLPATPVAFAQDVAEALGLSKSHPGTARLAAAIDAAPSTPKDTTPATDDGAKSDGMLTGFEVTNDEFARVKQLALQAVGGDMYHWELLRLNIDKLLLKRMYKGASKGMSSLAETIGSRGAAHGAAGEPQTGLIAPHETRRASPGPVDDGSPSMLTEQDAQSARTLAATMAREGGVA